MEKTIHLADCHRLVLDGLLICLSRFNQLQICGVSTECEDFLQAYRKSPTDIVIMDVHLSQIKTPKEIIEEVLMINPNCDILVISYLNTLRDIRSLFNYGIKGYLDKSGGFDSVCKAMEKISRGEVYMCSDLQDKLIHELIGLHEEEHFNTEIAKKFESITTRELEVLQLICNEYSSEEISNQLNISTHTVNTYRKNLLRKINVKNTVGLVKYALVNELV